MRQIYACLSEDWLKTRWARNTARRFSVLSDCVAWRFCRARRTNGEAAAPISSRFLCPRPPLLLSAPNQNRHATQATVLYHVFARKKCILCSVWLRHKNYFTSIPYVTLLWYSFYFGTFAHGLIRLSPRSLASLRGCSLAIIKGIGIEVIPNSELWKATANKLIKQWWPKDKDFLFLLYDTWPYLHTLFTSVS